MKKIMFVAMLLLALPSAAADLIGPPPSVMIGAGIAMIAAVLVLNYAINFALAFPMAAIADNAAAGAIAKGLLIITPIMLALESLFIGIVEPNRAVEMVSVWIFSFVLIFACYFITGEKIWHMEGWKAAAIAVAMAVLTNPAYLLMFI